MNIQELLAALQSNADAAAKPVAVAIDGVGTLYVRKRTVREFEEMARDQKNADKDINGLFGPSIANLLCEEDGKRYDAGTREALAKLLAAQPDDVFQKIITATDGIKKEDTKVEERPN